LIVEYVEFSAILCSTQTTFYSLKKSPFSSFFHAIFEKSDDNLVFNGIICCYFVKKLQVVESKMYEWWKRKML